MLTKVEKAVNQSLLNVQKKTEVLEFLKKHKKELGKNYPITSYHFFNEIKINPIQKLSRRLKLIKADKAFKKHFKEYNSLKEVLVFYKIYSQNVNLLNKIIEYNQNKAESDDIKKSFSVFYNHQIKKEKLIIKGDEKNHRIYLLQHFCTYPSKNLRIEDELINNIEYPNNQLYIIVDFTHSINENTISLLTTSTKTGISDFHNWLNKLNQNQITQLKNIDLNFLPTIEDDISFPLPLAYYLCDVNKNINKLVHCLNDFYDDYYSQKDCILFINKIYPILKKKGHEQIIGYFTYHQKYHNLIQKEYDIKIRWFPNITRTKDRVPILYKNNLTIINYIELIKKINYIKLQKKDKILEIIKENKLDKRELNSKINEKYKEINNQSEESRKNIIKYIINKTILSSKDRLMIVYYKDYLKTLNEWEQLYFYFKILAYNHKNDLFMLIFNLNKDIEELDSAITKIDKVITQNDISKIINLINVCENKNIKYQNFVLEYLRKNLNEYSQILNIKDFLKIKTNKEYYIKLLKRNNFNDLLNHIINNNDKISKDWYIMLCYCNEQLTQEEEFNLERIKYHH